MVPNRCPVTNQQGFTLLEIMTVVTMVAILAAFALPSYQEYARRNVRVAAQQEILKLAELMERHKSRNFSYKGFAPADFYGAANVRASSGDVQIDLPLGATGSQVQYTLTLLDPDANKALQETTATGMRWAIKATPPTAGIHAINPNLLANSSGLRCMTRNTLPSYNSCGTTGYDRW